GSLLRAGRGRRPPGQGSHRSCPSPPPDAPVLGLLLAEEAAAGLRRGRSARGARGGPAPLGGRPLGAGGHGSGLRGDVEPAVRPPSGALAARVLPSPRPDLFLPGFAAGNALPVDRDAALGGVARPRRAPPARPLAASRARRGAGRVVSPA